VTVRGPARFSIEQLRAATAALRHRGPDDEGLWTDDIDRVGLGHRRLSIIDLSAHGHQPMTSACGRWVMVYNGEVYNFQRIRADLESLGHRFAGTGDSEVVLEAFAEWGPAAVTRFIGMFAIALWHKPSKELHLLRDRLGVKPLYYRWDGLTMLFGSELRALRAFADETPEVDREALTDYLRYGYINAPRAIYRNTFKLPPGHALKLDASGELAVAPYWSVSDHVGRRAGLSAAAVEEELESLLIDAFRLRMISDVSVGVYLSGGVDSSLLAALLQRHGGQRIKTYTIGFDVPEYDESPYAAEVARHLGTEHHTRMLKVDDAKLVLPRWGDLYDEPFADESGIPTLMVSQVAAEQVKVVLSADGGDELFAGYNIYGTMLDQWGRAQRVPHAVRSLAARAIRGSGIPGRTTSPWIDRVGRMGRLGDAPTLGVLFDRARAHFDDIELRALTGRGDPTRALADVYSGSALEIMRRWDLVNYLPGDVLAKVDRATMATSIEGREPLLDHRIAEFAFSLPPSMHVAELGPKHLLKKILFRHVPRELVDRPKRGFAVPLSRWLAGDLRPMVAEHLDPTELKRHGLFDPRVVAELRKRLDTGELSAQRQVWSLLAFQIWYRRWMDAP
jgi:asparagine synthase (glutamine-hydrolysing)